MGRNGGKYLIHNLTKCGCSIQCGGTLNHLKQPVVKRNLAFPSCDCPVGTTPNEYLYSGEQFDPNVGFYYLRARYYDHANGRFVSPDPIPHP